MRKCMPTLTGTDNRTPAERRAFDTAVYFAINLAALGVPAPGLADAVAGQQLSNPRPEYREILLREIGLPEEESGRARRPVCEDD